MDMQKITCRSMWGKEVFLDSQHAQENVAHSASGNLLTKNYAEAFEQGLLVARSGNQFWQYHIAHFYLVGIKGYLQPDKSLGVKWYLTALENNQGLADFDLTSNNLALRNQIESLLTEEEILRVKLSAISL